MKPCSAKAPTGGGITMTEEELIRRMNAGEKCEFTVNVDMKADTRELHNRRIAKQLENKGKL